MQRIIFLDIDGPVIPSSQFFVDKHASYSRVFAPSCLAIVKRLLEDADAKLVTNSTHNVLDRCLDWDVPDGARFDLRQDLVAAGIPKERIHDDWRTLYPHGGKFSGSINRLDAINAWQAENGEADWIAFDDCDFGHERLILVDYDYGISTPHYNKAAEIFGIKPFIVLG